MEHPFTDIIIAGAGPAGLLLSKRGIKPQILEAAGDLDPRPRAAVYGPPAIPDFQRAGILDRVREQGITLERMTWRRSEDHSAIARYDGGVLEDVGGEDLRMTCLGLPELSKLMLKVYVQEHGGRVSWNHKVIEAGQDEEKAWVDVETPEGSKRLRADYVVGCDGAHGQVRKSMGCDFPGLTWEYQIVATNTYFDFEEHGFDDVNFIVRPKDFYMACKLDNNGLYRITYGETPDLTPSEMRANLDRKMHQRCAPTFRLGRLLLAADAVHLCNPWGGMGITGGFVDVGGLYECLAGYYDGRADESILDVYSNVRSRKWRDVTDSVSQANFKRVSDSDAEILLARDGFLRLCKILEGDVEEMKEMLMVFFDLRYDFTQHYKDGGNVATKLENEIEQRERGKDKTKAKAMAKSKANGAMPDFPMSAQIAV